MFKLFGKRKSAKQGHLGEESSFYYNEKLKRWVERGKEDEAAKEAELPPPPTTLSKSFSRHSVLSDPGPGPASTGSTTGKSLEAPDSGPPSGPPILQAKRSLADRYVPVGFTSSNNNRSSTTASPFLPAAAAPRPKPATFFIPSPAVSSSNLAVQDNSHPSGEDVVAEDVKSNNRPDQNQVAVSTESLLQQTFDAPAAWLGDAGLNADTETNAVADTEMLENRTSDNSGTDLLDQQQATATDVAPTSLDTATFPYSYAGWGVCEQQESSTFTIEAFAEPAIGYRSDSWGAAAQHDPNNCSAATDLAAETASSAAYFDCSQWGDYNNWTQEQKDYYISYMQYCSAAQSHAQSQAVAATSAMVDPEAVESSVDDTTAAQAASQTFLEHTQDVAMAGLLVEDVEILQPSVDEKVEDDEAVESGTPVFTDIPLNGEQGARHPAQNGVQWADADDDSASSNDGSAVSEQSSIAGGNLFAPLNWIKNKATTTEGKLVGMPWDNVTAVDYEKYWEDDGLQQPPEHLRVFESDPKDSLLASEAGTATKAFPAGTPPRPSGLGLFSAPLFASLQPSGNSLPNSVTPTSSMFVSSQIFEAAADPLPDASMEGMDHIAVGDAQADSEHWDNSRSLEFSADALQQTVLADTILMNGVSTDANQDGMPVMDDDGEGIGMTLSHEKPAELPTWPGLDGWAYVEGADYSKYCYWPDFSSYGDQSTWNAAQQQIYCEWYYGCQYYQYQLAQQAQAPSQGLSAEPSKEQLAQHVTAAALAAASGHDAEGHIQASAEVSRSASQHDSEASDFGAARCEHAPAEFGQELLAGLPGLGGYRQELHGEPPAVAGYGQENHGGPEGLSDPTASRVGPPSHTSHNGDPGRMPQPERHTFDDMPVDEMDGTYSLDNTATDTQQEDSHKTDVWNTTDIPTTDWDAAADGWGPVVCDHHAAGVSAVGDAPGSVLPLLRSHSHPQCLQTTNTPQPPHTPPRDDHTTSPAYIDEDIVPPTPTRTVEDTVDASSMPTPSTSSIVGAPAATTMPTGGTGTVFDPSVTHITTSKPSTSDAAHAACVSAASTYATHVAGLPPTAPTHTHHQAYPYTHDPRVPYLNITHARATSDPDVFLAHLGEDDHSPAALSVSKPAPVQHSPTAQAPVTVTHVADASSSFWDSQAKAAPSPGVLSPSVLSPGLGNVALAPRVLSEEEKDFFDHLGEDQDSSSAAPEPVLPPVYEPTEPAHTKDLPEPSSQMVPSSATHRELMEAAFHDHTFFSTLPGMESELESVGLPTPIDATAPDRLTAFDSTALGFREAAATPQGFTLHEPMSLCDTVSAGSAALVERQKDVIAAFSEQQQNVIVNLAEQAQEVVAASPVPTVSVTPEACFPGECASPSGTTPATVTQPDHHAQPSSQHNLPTGRTTPVEQTTPNSYTADDHNNPAKQSPNSYTVDAHNTPMETTTAGLISPANHIVTAEDMASSLDTATAPAQQYLFDWSQNPRPDWSLWGPRDTWGPDAKAMYDDWARWRKAQQKLRRWAKKGNAAIAQASADTAQATTTEYSAHSADTIATSSMVACMVASEQPATTTMAASAVAFEQLATTSQDWPGPSSSATVAVGASEGSFSQTAAALAMVEAEVQGAAVTAIVQEPSSVAHSVGHTAEPEAGPHTHNAVAHSALAEVEVRKAGLAVLPEEEPVLAVEQPTALELGDEVATGGADGWDALDLHVLEQEQEPAMDGWDDDLDNLILPDIAQELLDKPEAVVGPLSLPVEERVSVQAEEPAFELVEEEPVPEPAAAAAATDAPGTVAQNIPEVATDTQDDPEAAVVPQNGETTVSFVQDGPEVASVLEGALTLEAQVHRYNEKLDRFVQARESLLDEYFNLEDQGAEGLEMPDEKDNDGAKELMMSLGKATEQVQLLLKFCRDNQLDGEAFLRQNGAWE